MYNAAQFKLVTHINLLMCADTFLSRVCMQGFGALVHGLSALMHHFRAIYMQLLQLTL